VQTRVGGRLWFWVVLLGITGQLAWTVENMYLNLFVHETITDHPDVLALLVAASAAAATLATLLVGAWSDRTGRRREFIAAGYVLWGLSTACFGLVGVDSSAADAVAWAVVAIVTLDCVMSFLGSGANDAAYQAWITASTTPGNRAKVDGVVQTFQLVGMLIVFGALDPLTRDGRCGLFFALVGGVTALVGVAAWFGVRTAAVPQPSGTYLGSLVHGLRPTTVRAHPRLYLTLAAWAVLGASFQVFLPFLIIYVRHYLQIEAFAVVLGGVLVGASLLSILGGRVLDRVGPLRALGPLVGAYALGLLALAAARGMLPVIGAGTVAMGTFLLCGAALSATVRNLTPPDRAGQVQGLRMIAMILLPSLVGPFLGAAVIKGSGAVYTDEFGLTKDVPTPGIFVAAAVVAVLVVVPLGLLRRQWPPTPTDESPTDEAPTDEAPTDETPTQEPVR